ncbi:MAG: polysaccharide deacetylase family protein [Acidobacteria bacterium]|nr:polysaccharide deacetylase family protein [Acidobacteriota bacterium]
MRRGKRERVASVLGRLNVLEPMGSLGSRVQSELPILAYHRVVDIGVESDFPFDPELVSASPADFRAQMTYVRDHFNAITFGDVIRSLDGDHELPPRPIIVTFDDGFLDNYTNAYPVLRDLEMPATIFVSTGYIGSVETYWYDRVAYAIYRGPAGPFVLGSTRFELTDVASRRRATADAIRFLRGVADPVRRAHLGALEERIDCTVREADRHLSQAMDWSQVRELHDAGIEIGSHTVSHPALSQCDDETLAFELWESRRELETRLGAPTPVVAYPFGGPGEYDGRVMAAATQAGYRLAASYISGRNLLGALSSFELRRLHVERYTDLATFASMLQLPQLFAGAAR